MFKLNPRIKKSNKITEEYSSKYPDLKTGINTIALRFHDKKIYTGTSFKKHLDEYVKTGDLPKTVGNIEKNFIKREKRSATNKKRDVNKNQNTAAITITKAIRKFTSKTVISLIGGETALDRNIQTVELKINKVGNADAPMLAARTCWLARKQLSKEFKHYKIVAYIEVINAAGTKSQLKTHSYSSTQAGLNDFLDERIEKLDGGDNYYANNLEGAIVEFSFMNIVSGGTTRVEIINREDVLRRKSVLRIDNPNGNNCFWYALACLMYPERKALRDKSKNVRLRVANQLAEQCGMLLGNAVPLSVIPIIEKDFRG